MLGNLVVASGATLTIPAGTELQFRTGWSLQVNGGLVVQGTEEEPAVFTAASLAPTANAWDGIKIQSGAWATIDHAVVEYAATGISFTSIASSPSSSVTNSLIQYNNTGINVGVSSNPTILGNRIANNLYGIYLAGTQNDTTNPRPIINGNDLFNNPNGSLYVYRYGTTSTIILDVTGNWWGTTTPTAGPSGSNIVYTSYNPSVSTGLVNYSNAATSPQQGPVLTAISITEAYFSPNGDGAKDVSVLTGTLSQTATWNVDVVNSVGQVVRTTTGSGTSVSMAWDGRDTGGILVSDGRYSFIVSAIANNLGGRVGSSNVMLDTIAPTSNLDDGLASGPYQNVLSIPVTGTSNDANFLNYSLVYGLGTAPTTWTSIGAATIATQVTNGTLGTWQISSTDSSIVPIPNGDYTLRLTVTDDAGNVSTDTLLVTLDNMLVSSVSFNTKSIDFVSGNTSSVSFNLNRPATLTLKVYPQLIGITGAPVRTITQSYAAAGAYAIEWNGLDDQGNQVPDEAYVLVLDATDGVRTARYAPTTVTNSYFNIVAQQTSFNAYENEFWSTQINLSVRARARLEMTLTSDANRVIRPYGDGIAFDPGVQTVTWDGRYPDTGQVYIGQVSPKIYLTGFTANTVLVKGASALKIKGAAPNVEVKADPYIIYLSYGHFAKIVYNLTTPGNVPVRRWGVYLRDPRNIG
ncbi:MAG: gliding motility-associated C-terminal domain-containing protein [Gammaproteobacteria bacterium]|nr:gliding motility-associated C-terminal domain-containing protein [Gammaproteobacteria bacterium]